VKSHSLGDVLINGRAVPSREASISVFDIGFQRGYGCFEAMRAYNGVPFRLQQHLGRLERSAGNLRIPIPSIDLVADWCRAVASPGEGVVRVFVTGGVDMAIPGTDNVVIVFMQPLPILPPVFGLDFVDAPWHPDGRTSELTGAKTLSYGPNLAATIAAKSRGFDDAVLIGAGGTVLEGPTFSIGWVTDGVIYTPSLDANILESVTRSVAIEVADDLGFDVVEGSFPKSDLSGADEVFMMSTVREVSPVNRIGATNFTPGPVTDALRHGYQGLVATETA
jgi:branched-subunit amino acid aminotransferase/4-amino-4-deoxychorismate lyase